MRHRPFSSSWLNLEHKTGRRIAAWYDDRSGAVSVLFAVAAVAVFGFTGIATEAGFWYLEKRRAQNAADAAAMSGAIALANGATTGSGAVLASGADLAQRNGYGGAVAINNPPSAEGGPYAGNPLAVEAVATRTPRRLVSSLFLGQDVTIQGRAVAVVSDTIDVCALALAGPLTFNGNITVNAPGCAMVSNHRNSATSISCNGIAETQVQVGALVASGGISNCQGAVSPYQPQVVNPFAQVDGIPMPPVPASSARCQNVPLAQNGVVTLDVTTRFEHANKMFCSDKFGGTQFLGDLNIPSGVTLRLEPGTYVFYNASITLQGTVTCPSCTGGGGVTFVMTGSANGLDSNAVRLDVVAGATWQNVVPPGKGGSRYEPAFDGVLFYMDGRRTDRGAAPVKIETAAGGRITGGLYFPSVTASLTGNGQLASSCFEIVARSIVLSGNPSLDVSGCSGTGTTVGKVRAVLLVR